MASRNVLIHVGYHKTGSTTLQDHFFARDAAFLRWRDDRRLTHHHFVCLSSYASVDRHVLAELDRSITEANEAKRCFVISHERLSGYYATGGFDSAAIADRLYRAFPDARILIVIREQSAMLESAYSQYITDGGVMPFRKFMRLPSTEMRRAPEFDPSYFAYDHLIAKYQALFGRERVLVLPFELLRAAPAMFVAAITRHCGGLCDENSYAAGFPRANDRRNILVQSVVRWGNRWLWSQLNPAGVIESRWARGGLHWFAARISPLLDVVTPSALQRRRAVRIKRFADELYGPSNRRVMDLTGLDLARWGYTTTAMPRAGGALEIAESCQRV